MAEADQGEENKADAADYDEGFVSGKGNE